jgi:hypothetical protein
MFAKDKVSQSMIDAVNGVLAEKKMEDKEVEESGLRKKAHASAAAGKKSFEFLGKTLPVTVKKEEKKVEEGFGEMDKYLKDKEKEKGTGKYDKKKISTGTVYQKKHNAPKEDEKDDMKEDVEQIDEIQAEELIENFEMINEVSLGAKIKAYAHHAASSWEAGDYGHDEDMEKHQKRADKIHAHILKHHGTDAVHHAEKAADSAIFGTKRSHSRGKDTLSGGLRDILSKNVTKAGKIPKTTQVGMKNVAKGSYGNRVSGPKGNLPEEVELDEAVSRKHFQQVADLIKTHDSQEKRKELAQHHASIFKTQNPRFDHAKFMKAAGVNESTWAEEADCVTPPQVKKIAKKEVKGHEKTMHHQEEIDTDVRTKDMLKGRRPTKQTDDVGPGSDSKSTKVRYHGGPHPSNEEFEQVEERTLTAAETKKKEHMVMSMKPKLKDFKKRYGERAKEVMYATATKRAKGE